MIKLNEYQTMEVIADIMSAHGITLRQFNNHYFDSRIYNVESMLRTIELLKTDIENKRVVDSKDLHDDLFKNLEESK